MNKPVTPATLWRLTGWACLLVAGARQSLLYVQKVLALPEMSQAFLPPADSDNWLRLAQVRQWMKGGDFFDHTVAHTNAPFGGISIHWTRPVDFLVDIFARFAPASLTLDQRLMAAAAWLPVCLGIAGMAFLARASYRLFDHVQVLGCLLLTAYFSDAALTWYFSPGTVDHHGLLCVLWCGVLALLLRPPSPRDGLLIGLVLGVMLWISVEALLLIAPVYIILGVEGICRRGEEKPLRPLACAALAAALVSAAGLCVETPAGRMFSDIPYDTLSAPYVFLMLLCAAAAAGLDLFFMKCQRVPARIGAAAGAGAGVALAMLLAFPKSFHGPWADSDAFIYTDFLPGIIEAQTLPAFFVKYRLFFSSEIFQPLLALLLMAATWRANFWRRHGREMAILCALFAWTFALMIGMVRWYYYVLPVSMILIAVLLPLWSARLRVLARMPRALRPYAVLCAFALVLPVALRVQVAPPTAADICDLEIMHILESGQLQPLLGQAQLILLTEQDIGGAVQFLTPYRIIAANYNREVAGMRYLKTVGNAADEDTARALLAQRNVDALLVCPEKYPAGWLGRLNAPGAKLPPWLLRAGTLKYALTDGAKPLLFRVNTSLIKKASTRPSAAGASAQGGALPAAR